MGARGENCKGKFSTDLSTTSPTSYPQGFPQDFSTGSARSCPQPVDKLWTVGTPRCGVARSYPQVYPHIHRVFHRLWIKLSTGGEPRTSGRPPETPLSSKTLYGVPMVYPARCCRFLLPSTRPAPPYGRGRCCSPQRGLPRYPQLIHILWKRLSTSFPQVVDSPRPVWAGVAGSPLNRPVA